MKTALMDLMSRADESDQHVLLVTSDMMAHTG